MEGLLENSRAGLSVNLKPAFIVWWAMAGSVAAYMIIANLFGEDLHGIYSLGPALEKLRTILAVVSIVILYAARAIYAKTMGKALQRTYLPGDGVGALAVVFMAYVAALIAVLAMTEAVAIFGLLLFMAGDSIRVLYVFCFVSLLGMWPYYPSSVRLNEIIMRVRQGGAG